MQHVNAKKLDSSSTSPRYPQNQAPQRALRMSAILFPASEVLSHFARTVGTVLVPTLSKELQQSTPSPKRQRQVGGQEAGGSGGGGFPFGQFGQYPGFGPQQFGGLQNFYPGGVGGLGVGGGFVDPRLYRGQIGGQRPLAALRPQVAKAVDAGSNGNDNENLKVSLCRFFGVLCAMYQSSFNYLTEQFTRS